MRYLTITYMKRPDGKMDEIVALTKKIKARDMQTASVILDFKMQKVLVAHMAGKTIDKDWSTIRDCYYQYYQKVIDDLETLYGHVPRSQTATADQSGKVLTNP